MISEFPFVVHRKTIFRFSKVLLLLFIFGVGCITTNAQSDSVQIPTSIFLHLTQEEGARMTLETDFTELLTNRKMTDYIPATLTMADGKVYKAQVKPRGRYRRKVCEVPPLKIKFSKKMLREEGLDTLNEIKLVIPCTDNSAGDDLIVKEYLIYKMFERLTAASVKARLVRMTLRDTHVESASSKRQILCLLLEDEEETCVRLNGEEKEVYGISPDSLTMNQAALVSIFQYMIGNTDWDISMMRNCRLIQSKESSKVLVVPYDFDFSGLVGAPYASPSSESGLRTVRDRFLMADGIKEESLRRAVQIIKSAKKDLLDTCRSKHLSRDQSLAMINYLETFFQEIESKDMVPIILNYSNE